MSENTVITSKQAPAAVGLYPHSRRVGNLLFLSGLGPRVRGSQEIPGTECDENGKIITYDIAPQCHSVFKNLRYVLEDSGSSWDQLIDVTVFLTNMEKDFAAYNALYAEYFKTCQPCRTTLEVKSLPTVRTPIAIELKCIAMID